MLSRPMKLKQTSILITIILMFGVLANLPLPVNEQAENFFLDLKFKLRGSRDFSKDIALVFIGQEDMLALDQWQNMRDFYGYVTFLLKSAGAKVIGLDILFPSADTRYPENDNDMANYFQFAGNVVLPMIFQEWEYAKTESNCYHADVPLYPFEKFRAAASGIGFSNLGEDAFLRKVPIVAQVGDEHVLSFGTELAKLFLDSNSDSTKFTLPQTEDGCIYLNHFGDLSRIQAISFVDFLQPVKSDDDSLNFKDKLVLIAVTAPGRAVLKATPLSQAIAASLIHLTVAENLIKKNFLRKISAIWLWFVLLLCAFWLWIAWQPSRLFIRLMISAIGIVILGSISYFCFLKYYLIVPTFYPFLAYLTGFLFLFISFIRQREQHSRIQEEEFKKEISSRTKELESAQSSLSEFQTKLNVELAEKKELSEESQAQLHEHKLKVVALEKKVRDLEAFQHSVQQAVAQPDSDIKFSASSKMVDVMSLIERISQDDIPVLISGETGTGKEVVARAIHRKSRRHKGPFVAVNCGALPETLLESELFGHEKGSFTGAQSRRRGRFELADGGTLFLDEITETNPAFQARLLRALQEGTIERLGSEQLVKVNVRVIAASNRNVRAAVDSGEFRADLFYRLNGFPVELPPLRERTDDIPLLAVTFLKKHGYKSIDNFSNRAMELLKGYGWPGNVRELENVVRRSAIMAQSEKRKLVQVKDLPPEISENTVMPEIETIHKPLEDQILEMLRMLNFSHTSISQTAKALGNRDRGTITEYFRGMCFEYLVQANFNIPEAAQAIVAENNEQAIEKVKSKLESYLKNLQSVIQSFESSEIDENAVQAKFKGLPKKYYPDLIKVIEHFRNI